MMLKEELKRGLLNCGSALSNRKSLEVSQNLVLFGGLCMCVGFLGSVEVV